MILNHSLNKNSFNALAERMSQQPCLQTYNTEPNIALAVDAVNGNIIGTQIQGGYSTSVTCYYYAYRSLSAAHCAIFGKALNFRSMDSKSKIQNLEKLEFNLNEPFNADSQPAIFG